MSKQSLTAIVKDKKGRILAIGRNSYVKTHPLMLKAARATGNNEKRLYLHAEVAALLKVPDWQKAHSMEVIRFTKDGKPALAKPCDCCQYILKQTGIKKVIHT